VAREISNAPVLLKSASVRRKFISVNAAGMTF
jgi:hypothetical protein